MTETMRQDRPHGHLHELLLGELFELLAAENQLLNGLQRMADAAHRDALQAVLRLHLRETEMHIERLKLVFQELGISPRRKKSKAMEGLLREAEDLIDELADTPAVRDAALIAMAQKVEHYEIAAYGCVLTYAELMELPEVSALLAQTLDEEKQTDELLTEIALEVVEP